MRITYLFKDSNSTTGGCPAAYEDEDGNFLVQGKLLDAETFAQLRDVAPDETAVWIPRNIIEQLLEHLPASMLEQALDRLRTRA